MLRFVSLAVSRTGAAALMFTGALLAVAVALALIVIQLVGERPVLNGIACQLGVSQTCLLQDLEEERQRLRGLRERTAELEALYQRLSALEHASSSYTLFTFNSDVRPTVVTGIEYASLIEPDQLTSGRCYIDLGHRNGVQRHVTIATFETDLRVRSERLNAAQLQASGLSRNDMNAALARCAWPEEVRGGLS